MKSLKILPLVGLLIFLGCRKEENNPKKYPSYGKMEIIHGDNQLGLFGTFLSDSIVIKATSNKAGRLYLIKYEMIEGNGNTKREGEYNYSNVSAVDTDGILEINWSLGCDLNVQKIKLILYVDSTKNEYDHPIYYKNPSASLIINANATKPSGWGRACGCDNVEPAYSRIRSYQSTLYLTGRGLKKSVDGGLNWEKVEGVPNWEEITNAQFNSLGWLYVFTKYHGVCYSKDLENWEFINNGVRDFRDPNAFLIEDTTLFVNFHYDGLYKTTDNGQNWKKIFVGENAGGSSNITRHPNGDIYLFDSWGILWISKNNGDSWNKVNIEYKYVRSPIRDLEISENGMIYIGANDAAISEISPITYQGDIHTYYQWNGSSQQVDHILIKNNDVFFLVKGNLKPGIYSKANNWYWFDTGFRKKINYFYLKSDNRFMILSDDGLYYYHE